MTGDERLREVGALPTHGPTRKPGTGGPPARRAGGRMAPFKLFVCVQCGFEYDEAKGWPEDGISPGTRWDDIPDDWSCPDCGAAKSDFEMVEVARS
jgi:rubredoxin